MNDHEVRRRLQEIERECAREDPQWTSRMRRYAAPDHGDRWRWLAVDMMGCSLLVIGATASVFFVFLLGAVVLGTGVCQQVAASRKRGKR